MFYAMMGAFKINLTPNLPLKNRDRLSPKEREVLESNGLMNFYVRNYFVVR